MIGPAPALEVEDVAPIGPVWWVTRQGTLGIVRCVGTARGGRLPMEVLMLVGEMRDPVTQLHIAIDWLRLGGNRLQPEEGPTRHG